MRTARSQGDPTDVALEPGRQKAGSMSTTDTSQTDTQATGPAGAQAPPAGPAAGEPAPMGTTAR